MRFLWVDNGVPNPDDRGAFRGSFTIESESDVRVNILGATWFRVWLDGQWLCDGPARFEPTHPEWQFNTRRLATGDHVIAAMVLHEGIETKRMPPMPPFLAVHVFGPDEETNVSWLSRKVQGQRAQMRRINYDCGWIDWQDTRRDPDGWIMPGFDDSSWEAAIDVAIEINEPSPPTIANVQSFDHALTPIARGDLAETFGYEDTDPAARFFLRDLECLSLPRQGVRRRYDLGRVRLGSPRFKLDLPEGAIVEFGYAEYLRSGRVAPWVTLTNQASCHFDHYVARGGPQEFFPLTPKGGRFMEIHIVADPMKAAFLSEQFVERGYYGAPEGDFQCSDPMLNAIWHTCVETFRACAEDAITDCPTRERGQWTGDATVALETASVAYADLRLLRRMLYQAAQCARADGLIVCLSPAQGLVLPTSALLWVTACIRYHQLTGDYEALELLFDAAERNLEGFSRHWSDNGITSDLGWMFVDWGYSPPSGQFDPVPVFYYLQAIRAMSKWCDLIGRTAERERYVVREAELGSLLRTWMVDRLAAELDPWLSIGLHVATLALDVNLLTPEERLKAGEFIERHVISCFPNEIAARRLSDPSVISRDLITPYYMNYSFPPLIEMGESDFVLEQYRRSWGWMIKEGFTTCLEVFDTRWSHCHQWSAAPAWQLSRYALGVHARFDYGFGHFVLNMKPGSLQFASGYLPLREKARIEIKWTRSNNGHIRYVLASPEPIWIHISPRQVVAVDDVFEIELDASGNPIAA